MVYGIWPPDTMALAGNQPKPRYRENTMAGTPNLSKYKEDLKSIDHNNGKKILADMVYGIWPPGTMALAGNQPKPRYRENTMADIPNFSKYKETVKSIDHNNGKKSSLTWSMEFGRPTPWP